MAVATSTRAGLDPDVLIPDLLREHPGVRSVLDRHGLRGCGGPGGPYETVRYFARAHGVELSGLMEELDAEAGRPSASEPAPETAPDVADTIYRRFFLAGIAVVLSAGATWGAWLLWRIGLGGSFVGSSVHAVNAHGEAQIQGWVGLFVMGFAYQAFPRIWQTTLAAPRYAVAVFHLMLAGIVVRTLGITAAGAWDPAPWVALAGGLMELAAVYLFVLQIAVTFRQSGAKVEAYVGYVVVALAWFLLATAFSVWHSWHTMTAPDAASLVQAVATYQAPLRDLQIHGFALTMILGVSLRMLPGLYATERVSERRAWVALGVLIAAVAAEAAVFLVYRWTGDHRVAAGLVVAWAALTASAVTVAWPWRAWRAVPEPDRSAKFVRAAYAWLPVALVLLLLMPAYQWLAGVGFSHAYFGATRHAITVGFVSLMIMGVAAKVVPTLNGVDPRTLPSLTVPFVLINLGCFLRVALQIATDWDGRAFALIGLSGTLEVTALAWWGLGLAAVIRRGRALDPAAHRAGPPPPADRGGAPRRRRRRLVPRLAGGLPPSRVHRTGQRDAATHRGSPGDGRPCGGPPGR